MRFDSFGSVTDVETPLPGKKKSAIRIMAPKNKLISKPSKTVKPMKKPVLKKQTTIESKDEEKQVEDMFAKAWKVRENAYAPYSSFKVGSTLRSKKTGKIYAGCNVENAAFPSSICAERGALMQAVAAEGPGI